MNNKQQSSLTTCSKRTISPGAYNKHLPCSCAKSLRDSVNRRANGVSAVTGKNGEMVGASSSAARLGGGVAGVDASP